MYFMWQYHFYNEDSAMGEPVPTSECAAQKANLGVPIINWVSSQETTIFNGHPVIPANECLGLPGVLVTPPTGDQPLK